MAAPITAGCLAEVIDGTLGAASPNLGLMVRVLAYVGDHSRFGRIWRCEAEYAERAQNPEKIPAGQVDFAQDWLRRVDEPPKVDTAQREREREEA